MKKYFYSHIVETEFLIVLLNNMEMSGTEKSHLLSLVESSLHYTVLDVVLTHLSEKDKRIFMKKLSSQNHEETWEFVKEKVENAEEKIRKAAKNLTNELHKDILEVRKIVKT